MRARCEALYASRRFMIFSSQTATMNVSYDERRLELLTLWQNNSERITLAIMRYKDARCVVDEVVEIQKVHLVPYE
jgi:hypothetical protein